MKHASSREMFRYWDDCRGARPAPERDELDPGVVRRALGDSLVLSIDRTAGHPFRLAGTRLCALFCRELKGESFIALWEPASQPMITELIREVTTETVGVVAGATAPGEQPVVLEMLLLPLVHRGRLDTRLIGVLAPLAVPYWLGQTPIGSLTLGAFRHLGPAAQPTRGHPLVPALSLIEGGRAEA